MTFLINLFVAICLCSGAMAELYLPPAPENLISLTKDNYETLLRDSDKSVFVAFVQQNYDHKLLQNMALLQEEYPENIFTYVNTYSEDGELIKATYECGMIP